MGKKRPPVNVTERLKKLKKTIEHYRVLYHVEDKEEIASEALDSLKHELVKIEEEYPELKTPDSPSGRVAGKPLEQFKKIAHKVPQWSFNDAFTEEDMFDFDARVKKVLKTALGKDISPTYVCELKIDGLKIVLDYQKGVLSTAATRGDGKIGEDVTLNVRTIESVPLRLSEEIDVIVEGEVWIGKKNLEKLNLARQKAGEPPFANPRNAAAGGIRQLDPKIAASRQLDSFIYDLAYSERPMPKNQIEELQFIQKLGFKINKNYRLCRDINEVIIFWKDWQKKFQKEEYLLDGVVVKVNPMEYQTVLGFTGKAPRYAIALKFAAKKVTTVVEDITLQIGRTGVLTPVAHLRPVAVSGSMVSRATLHNEDEIKRLDVRIGDTVIVQKAGDVIPDIVQVIKDLRTGKEKLFIFPRKMSECGGDGRIERVSGQAAWRCVSKNSVAVQKRKLYHFVSKKAFNIERLGPKIIDVLLAENIISSFDDIFTIKKGDLINLPRFGEKSVENILTSIEKSRKTTLPRFLVGLSIPQVGEETATALANHFGTLEKLRDTSVLELEAMEGVGPVVAKSLRDWFDNPENKKLVKKLIAEIFIEKSVSSKIQGVISGKKFVLTGTLQTLGREEAKEKIRALGGDVSSSVSARTDFVVAGAEPGSKFDKAKELGVRILSEDEFLKMIR